MGDRNRRPFVILRLDLDILGDHPGESVTVKGFAPDLESADREVKRLNDLEDAERIYVHRVARGIEAVIQMTEDWPSDS